jgi:hypothetical protein
MFSYILTYSQLQLALVKPARSKENVTITESKLMSLQSNRVVSFYFVHNLPSIHIETVLKE